MNETATTGAESSEAGARHRGLERTERTEKGEIGNGRVAPPGPPPLCCKFHNNKYWTTKMVMVLLDYKRTENTWWTMKSKQLKSLE